MRVIDVDSHVHEPIDWLEQIDPELAETLGPPLRFFDAAVPVFGTIDPGLAQLPAGRRPKAPLDLIAPGFVEHLEMTETRQPEQQGGDDPTAMYNAESRLRWCDQRGIDVQFLNPTFLLSTIITAVNAGRTELPQRILGAWNSWMAEQTKGHTDRLIPVTLTDLTDIEWSVAQMARMRELGSRAFMIPEVPVSGHRSAEGSESPMRRSITHPDFEPLWNAAEELGMAAIAHVGVSRESINVGWANNGADNLSTYALLRTFAGRLSPQLLVAAMALDGVFERHPRLTLIVEELGIDWLPGLLTSLDIMVGRVPADLRDDEYRPSFLALGDSYTLPLAPVDYVRRQVRVTPLAVSHPIAHVLEQVPHELVCFSSDYPHVEGTADAIEIFDRQLTGQSATVKESFYGGIGELIGV